MTTASEWSGKVGDVWAAEWRRTDRSFADLSRCLDPAILAAAPATVPTTATTTDTATATTLDIGCGAGATSIALATARADLTVTGIDVSADLVATARTRAAACTNARFVHADLNDAHADLPRADLLCSRHGVMFFADPVAAFTRLRGVALAGAPLVFSCFRDAALNPWASALVTELTGIASRRATDYTPGPFGFADRAIVADILARSGWGDATAEPIDFRYVAGAGDDPVADAVEFFRRIGPVAAALREAPANVRASLLDKLADALQKRLDQGEVAFPAAAWIWRARAAGEHA